MKGFMQFSTADKKFKWREITASCSVCCFPNYLITAHSLEKRFKKKNPQAQFFGGKSQRGSDKLS